MSSDKLTNKYWPVGPYSGDGGFGYLGGYPGVRPALNLESGVLVSEIKD